jgi:tetratricopeptide (TPR) repeat protein
MPNVVAVPVGMGESEEKRIDEALAVCEGEYTVVVPCGFPVGELWLEESLYSLVNGRAYRCALELEGSTEQLRAFVVRTDELRDARKEYAHLPIRDSLVAFGVSIRRVSPEEIPFQLDQSLAQARLAGEQSNWRKAAGILEYAAEHYGNGLWLNALIAEAYFKSAQYDRSAELCHKVNSQRPIVDTLLLEAKVNKKAGNDRAAVDLLERAIQILEGTESVWT